ncbi:MAG: tetratricopeptide repeat protein [Bacteroidia bacterium]
MPCLILRFRFLLILFAFLFVSQGILPAQRLSPADQEIAAKLYALIQHPANDTILADSYIRLGELFSTVNTDSVLSLCTKAIHVDDKNLQKNAPGKERDFYLLNKAFALSDIGYYWKNSGQMQKALECQTQSLQIRREIGKSVYTYLALKDIGLLYTAMGNYKNAHINFREALQIATDLNYEAGIGDISYDIAIVDERLGDNLKALSDYQQALKYRDLSDTNQYAILENSLGNIYDSQGDLKNALQAYSTSLSLFESVNNSVGIADCFSNLSRIYFSQGDTAQSIDYLVRSRTLYEKTNNLEGIGLCWNNLGVIAKRKGQFKQAMDYFNKSLTYRSRQGDSASIAQSLSNIGRVYDDMDSLVRAESYIVRAYHINERLGARRGLTVTMLALSELDFKQKKYKEAESFGVQSAQRSLINGYTDILQESEEYLTKIYEKEGKYDLALNAHRLYIQIRDSIKNTENKKVALRQQLSYEYDKKELEAKAEFDKNQALARVEFEKKQALSRAELGKKELLLDRNKKDLMLLEKENQLKALTIQESESQLKQKATEGENQKKAILLLNQDKALKAAEARQKEEALNRQKLLNYGLSAGGILVLLLLGLAIRAYTQKRKANQIIQDQKNEVEEQKLLIEEQKDLMEEKNKEIVDSIQYAKRIQGGLLASEQVLKDNLNEYFILFKPKDIVSGDFYWAHRKGEWFYMATADSTGHGVPGAFMSLLNISFLNEAINSTSLVRPDEILGYVRTRIIAALKTDGSDEGGKDGMDCVLCAYHFKDQILLASCAYIPIWIMREIPESQDKELIEIRPDKFPVGKHDRDHIPFTLQEIPLKKNDVIYTFTDGYADQFGGPNGKKFKYRQLEDSIRSFHQEPMDLQQSLLEERFLNWKGELEQVDDVCVMGVRI